MYGQYEWTRPLSSMVLAAAVLAGSQPSTAAQGGSSTPAGTLEGQQQSHPLDPALRTARHSLQHIRRNIRDYTAVMVKRLRIDGQLTGPQYLFVKIRNRSVTNGHVTTPMAVYLKFLKPDSVRGREVIWVEGRNEGKLIAHETGYKNFFRVKLDPAGYLAMRGQRYPLTDIGLEKLAEKLIETGERDRKYGECQVQLFSNAKVGQRVCSAIEVVHPVRRSHFDFYCARVFFDNELNVPIRYESWSWPTQGRGQPVLEEEYTYTNVRLNVGLTERDFDPDNSEYDFP